MTAKSMQRGLLLYGLVSLIVIGLITGVFIVIYHGDADRRAVVTSAVLALVVQVVAYAVARLVAQGTGGNLIAGWGLGALICLLVLVVYGFVCRATGLPTSAALVSLATFFFSTELIEAPLLTI